jgi:ribonucleotide reductase beta subunit family protein with ferritin-like domain
VCERSGWLTKCIDVSRKEVSQPGKQKEYYPKWSKSDKEPMQRVMSACACVYTDFTDDGNKKKAYNAKQGIEASVIVRVNIL